MSSPTETRPEAPAATTRYAEALNLGMATAMEEDPTVVLIGIDVGAGGGIFTVTKGLYDRFGPDRVLDAPISEMGYVGAAVGAAMTGLRPIVEIMFMDFVGVCLDPILNQAAKLRYMTAGAFSIPVVFRTQTGAGRSAGAQHSQSLEAIFAHIPGLKVVMPATVTDAHDLLGRLRPRSQPGGLRREPAAVRNARQPRRCAAAARQGTRRPRGRGADGRDLGTAAARMSRGRRNLPRVARGRRPALARAARHRNRRRVGAKDRSPARRARGRPGLRRRGRDRSANR